jgi:hypothetical protein
MKQFLESTDTDTLFVLDDVIATGHVVVSMTFTGSNETHFRVYLL